MGNSVHVLGQSFTMVTGRAAERGPGRSQGFDLLRTNLPLPGAYLGRPEECLHVVVEASVVGELDVVLRGREPLECRRSHACERGFEVSRLERPLPTILQRSVDH